MVCLSKFRFKIAGMVVFMTSSFRSDSIESLMIVMFSLFGISPSDILSVRFDKIFGVNIERIELVIARIIEIIIKNLYGFSSFNNLVTAFPKSFAFVSGLVFPFGLGIF